MARKIIEHIAIAIIIFALNVRAKALAGPKLEAVNPKAAYNKQSTGSLISLPAVPGNNPSVGSHFGAIYNITAQTGASAYLPCRVKRVFNKSVSWVRVRDDHILTVDQTTFIADERFHAFHIHGNMMSSSLVQPLLANQADRFDDVIAQKNISADLNPTNAPWMLQIKYVQARDDGLYECQISVEPKISARVYLHVVVPRTETVGETVRYVKEGSRVALHCVITGAIDPPLYVIWYHHSQQIFPDNVRQWKTEISHQQSQIPKGMSSTQAAENRKTVGSLIMPSVQKKDSGNFTCSPSNSADATIVLNVINGEYSASAITSSSSLGCDPRKISLSVLILSFCLNIILNVS